MCVYVDFLVISSICVNRTKLLKSWLYHENPKGNRRWVIVWTLTFQYYQIPLTDHHQVPPLKDSQLKHVYLILCTNLFCINRPYLRHEYSFHRDQIPFDGRNFMLMVQQANFIGMTVVCIVIAFFLSILKSKGFLIYLRQ